ncbi:MAG: hypothetical protein ABWW66_04210 [Archaeoglobaceae archaeon]
MRLLECLAVVVLMLLPFVFPKSADLTTYAYWLVLTAAYLVTIAVRRWELE